MPHDTHLRLEPVPFPAALLEDPSHASQLRSSLWLLLVLRAVAAPRTGTVLATPDELAQIAGTKRETLLSQLGHLRTGGYLALQHQSGHLRVKLTHWQGPPPEPTVETDPEPDPVALRVATVLGDQDHLERYEEVVESYPRSIVERALRDAAAMPASRIRRSRGALFEYLIRQYAESEFDDE